MFDMFQQMSIWLVEERDMNLKVLGSGSSGNCYLLQNDDEALVIEAGIPFLEVKKALEFNVKKIVGVVVSHSHGDHARYISEYEKAGIPVFKPYAPEIYTYVRYGEFVIRSFDLVHDVPCFGFYIKHPDIGRLVYASDTEYIKYRFKELNHILVECNYDKRLIPDDAVNRSHVMTGHMELETTLEFLRVNNNPDLRNVILLHLSQTNSSEDDFLERARNIVEADCYIARKGLEVSLDLTPF